MHDLLALRCGGAAACQVTWKVWVYLPMAAGTGYQAIRECRQHQSRIFCWISAVRLRNDLSMLLNLVEVSTNQLITENRGFSRITASLRRSLCMTSFTGQERFALPCRHSQAEGRNPPVSGSGALYRFTDKAEHWARMNLPARVDGPLGSFSIRKTHSDCILPHGYMRTWI